MLFPEFVEEEDSKFISASQMKEYLKDKDQVCAIFASLKVESEAAMVDIFVVCEFPYVFPDEITGLPPERLIFPYIWHLIPDMCQWHHTGCLLKNWVN